MAGDSPLRVPVGVMLPCPHNRSTRHDIAHLEPSAMAMLRRRERSLGNKERNSLYLHQAVRVRPETVVL